MVDFTKGKWTIFENMSGLKEFPEGHIQIIGDGQRDNVAIIPKRWNNSEANAHLIAAAPDMYEALKGLLERDEYGSIRLPTQASDIMKKALAKAEGRK